MTGAMGDGSKLRTRVALHLPLSFFFPLGGQTGFGRTMALDSRALVFGA